MNHEEAGNVCVGRRGMGGARCSQKQVNCAEGQFNSLFKRLSTFYLRKVTLNALVSPGFSLPGAGKVAATHSP